MPCHERERNAKMAINSKKALFDLYRKSLEVAELTTASGDSLICPLCWQEKTFDNLTLEHIIPSSVGGKQKILTCGRCNNDQGSALDAHLANYQAVLEAFQGHGSLPSTLIVRGTKVAANLVWNIGKKDFKIVGEASNPAAVDAIQDDFKAGLVSEVEFAIPFGYSENNFQTAVLRASYLVAFWRFGYEYAKHEIVQGVRRRICDPSLEHPRLSTLIAKLGKLAPKFDLPHFMVPGDVNGVGFLFVVIRVKKATTTYFGVHLPAPGDRCEEFFDLMEQYSREHDGATISIRIDCIIT